MYFVTICLGMKKKRGSVFFLKYKDKKYMFFYFKNIKIHFKNYPEKIISSLFFYPPNHICFYSCCFLFYFILFFKIVIKHCLDDMEGYFFIYRTSTRSKWMHWEVRCRVKLQGMTSFWLFFPTITKRWAIQV
jgi:hypothetical protein